MKIKKIVYLTETPFSQRDKDRFGVDIFLNHGLEVIVLDITVYMDKYVSENYISTSDINYDCVKKMNTYKKIKNFILNTKDVAFISFIGESSIKSLKILNLLTAHKKQFGIILSGSLPKIAGKYNLSNRLKLFSTKNLKRLSFKAFYLLVSVGFKYSFVIASGKESYKVIQHKYKDVDIINGHAFDYDLYLENKKNDIKIEGDYAVYLDEFFPFHPDYIRHGIDYSSFADSYYDKLSTFFDYIEELFGLEVIISAHPRSYYDKLPNYWNKRKVIRGNTINLVKNSKICLLHASTSINFAILYNIPTIFITMQEINKSNVQETLEAMSIELDSTIVDIDTFNNSITLDVKYNQSNYDSYKTKYIKSPNSQELNNWELLYDYYIQKESATV